MKTFIYCVTIIIYVAASIYSNSYSLIEINTTILWIVIFDVGSLFLPILGLQFYLKKNRYKNLFPMILLICVLIFLRIMLFHLLFGLEHKLPFTWGIIATIVVILIFDFNQLNKNRSKSEI